MTDSKENYTKAAALLNQGKQRTAEDKLWDRRSVAAVVRRLQALKLWP
jgi:chloramphenicol 3-O-phosphotransferase